MEGSLRFHEAFVWSSGVCTGVHKKAYLPNEPGFFEQLWYTRGSTTGFDVVSFQVRGETVNVGFMMCTEVPPLPPPKRIQNVDTRNTFRATRTVNTRLQPTTHFFTFRCVAAPLLWIFLCLLSYGSWSMLGTSAKRRRTLFAAPVALKATSLGTRGGKCAQSSAGHSAFLRIKWGASMNMLKWAGSGG